MSEPRPISRYFLGVPLFLLAAVATGVGLVLTRPHGTYPRPTAEAPRVTAALPTIDQLARPHETALTVGREFFADSRAALRCEVHAVKSFTEIMPLPGATVKIRLRGADGRTRTLHEGKADAAGVAAVSFRVPDVTPGPYALEVETKSALGRETLSREVHVKAPVRVLLVTDKPLYQPGQVMHLRALALRTFDLTPVVRAEIAFEIQDGRGNKVFQRALHTSEYGVAAADFQLADEVNTGTYTVRAVLGNERSDKAVTVRRYTLPKFKTELTADRPYYLPGQHLRADIQADYFFGKPVAGARVGVSAGSATGGKFQTWEGRTDPGGHARYEVDLPELKFASRKHQEKAEVWLEVTVTDTAGPAETVRRSWPVADRPLAITLVPEAGRLVPGLENRVFVAASYPDGTPARCGVRLWLGRKAGTPLAVVTTSASGLAEFRLTPRGEQFRRGDVVPDRVETLAGEVPLRMGPANVLDVVAEARDPAGNVITTTTTLDGEPLGENVLLRLDRAIYPAGEPLKLDIHTSAGLSTVSIEVVRGGQVLLSREVPVKGGRARDTLALPPQAFGTLEVHAHQVLLSGEVIRDARVVYAHPADGLRVDVQADRSLYAPGSRGSLLFRVTDRRGKPAPAALGVLVLDEAVYGLQEVRPGLEKLFFTLGQELREPPAPDGYRPAETVGDLVRGPALDEDRQRIARVLLAALRPRPPVRWVIDPVRGRQRQLETRLEAIGRALFEYASDPRRVLAQDAATGAWHFRANLLREMVDAQYLSRDLLTDPAGIPITLAALARLEKGFNADRLGRAVTHTRLEKLTWAVVNYMRKGRPPSLGDGAAILTASVRRQGLGASLRDDAWGRPIHLVRRPRPAGVPSGREPLAGYELVSAGPDGKFGTADDVRVLPPKERSLVTAWWVSEEIRTSWVASGRRRFRPGEMALFRVESDNKPLADMADRGQVGGNGGGMRGNFQGGVNLGVGGGIVGAMGGFGGLGGLGMIGGGFGPPSAAPPPPRVRAYFPETLLWRPALITDDKGEARLTVPFADSITTWRLTASASSRAGLLGGATVPLRVFQDFFIDPDLPAALTCHDEIAFPVAVHNYLKEPQTVTLELRPEPWFEPADGHGPRRVLTLKPGEVTSATFCIRARRSGHFSLTVTGRGTHLSDAVKRQVEVVPDGRVVEQVVTDGLGGSFTRTVVIPNTALDSPSKLLVKVYPGILSQLLEGIEGMLKMPGGCFEQTSSSAYPNLLVVDYLERNGLASSWLRARTKEYLNLGYQRLLTFERPGGGFDLWGTGEPEVWLSAYGLHEFSDMARVYPVDRRVIERTQNWLMQQQEENGTWAGTGHAFTPDMGDPKLLLTSYVVWSLLESGHAAPALRKSVGYIRARARKADNTYVLALAANALAAWAVHDKAVRRDLDALLDRLEARKQRNEEGACYFPSAGHSLTYARDESLTVETTALTVLALKKAGRSPAAVKQALVYLVKSRDASGTWGSTSASILALKALTATAVAPKKSGTGFTILVNGKEAARGRIRGGKDEVMQLFDLGNPGRGRHKVAVRLDAGAALVCQVVARHFEPWPAKQPSEPLLAVKVDYGRTRLSTSDVLRATATLAYRGKSPTKQVIVELGLPPGFTPDTAEFAALVDARRIERFEVGSRRVILYLGEVEAGAVRKFAYTLRPKYPLKAKAPATVAYEYYTPADRATAPPVELLVEADRKQ